MITGLHLTSDLAPGAGATAAGVHTVVTYGVLNAIGASGGHPHSHGNWGDEAKALQQRQTHTLSMVSSRNAGKARETPQREATVIDIVTLADAGAPLI